jgi:hypothetical protein
MLLSIHKIEAKRLRFMGELCFPGMVSQGFGFLSESGRAGRILDSTRDILIICPVCVHASDKAKPAKTPSPGFGRYSAFCLLGFSWLSRFEVRGSGFEVGCWMLDVRPLYFGLNTLITTLTHGLIPLLPKWRQRAAGPFPWQETSPAAFKLASKVRIHSRPPPGHARSMSARRNSPSS